MTSHERCKLAMSLLGDEYENFPDFIDRYKKLRSYASMTGHMLSVDINSIGLSQQIGRVQDPVLQITVYPTWDTLGKTLDSTLYGIVIEAAAFTPGTGQSSYRYLGQNREWYSVRGRLALWWPPVEGEQAMKSFVGDMKLALDYCLLGRFKNVAGTNEHCDNCRHQLTCLGMNKW